MSMLPSFRVKLGPLRHFLDDKLVSEIVVNRPFEAFVMKRGSGFMERHDVPEMNYLLLESLTELIASFSSQVTDEKAPLLSASIPVDLDADVSTTDTNVKKYRVQTVRPPAAEPGNVILAVRKDTLFNVSVEDLDARGMFDHVNDPVPEIALTNARLLELYTRKHWTEFLAEAVRARLNIIVSAGTNTGKTTLLNALSKFIPLNERIGTIEDSRELKLPHFNSFNLLYSRGGQGFAKVSDEDLLRACMRLSPDRIMLGELRGSEAFAYLESTMSGHPGSLSTIHAGSPDEMWDRLVSYALRGAPNGVTRDEILRLARRAIDVVIQLQYDKVKDKRYISEIYYAKAH